MEHHVTIPLEIIRVLAVFGAFLLGFYRLVRPETRRRRAALLVTMAAFRPGLLLSGNLLTRVVLRDAICILWVLVCAGVFIGICGKPRRTSITFAYYGGFLFYLDALSHCAMSLSSGGLVDFNSPIGLVNTLFEAVFMLCWGEYYYCVMRRCSTALPFRFWLAILFPLYAGWLLLNSFIKIDSPLPRIESEIIWFGLSFSLLLLFLNLLVFYLYVKLSVSYEARVFAGNLAGAPPPVWTLDEGLSAAFIERYKITPRERETAEIMLRGKNDKEIAHELGITVNTVQAHLKSIYRKTGAGGRFALSALVRGG
ncbi:MAG: helix-turn-helix transcriptional regulator [Treponema sp.]|jgi:DNA-binding CsgD family transcriptional regulator|nr:helix-turn-helix transcriptional regulator [Treponema sp.]